MPSINDIHTKGVDELSILWTNSTERLPEKRTKGRASKIQNSCGRQLWMVSYGEVGEGKTRMAGNNSSSHQHVSQADNGGTDIKIAEDLI